MKALFTAYIERERATWSASRHAFISAEQSEYRDDPDDSSRLLVDVRIIRWLEQPHVRALVMKPNRRLAVVEIEELTLEDDEQ